MAKRRKRKPTLDPKFKARRAMLVLVIVALVAVAAWLLWPDKAPVEENQSGPSDEQSGVESQSESQSQVESESESESEPEPEPEPVVSTTDWNLLLVNSTSPTPDNFSVELETIVDTYKVDKRIAPFVIRMITQAKTDGIDLMICSAYRPRDYQEQLFDTKKKSYIDSGRTEEDAVAATAALIARPGTSEHETGLALDIVTPNYQGLDAGFAETPAFKWLDENAYKYGFILRYPDNKVKITAIDYEPWHYRYVGEEAAKAIKDADYCLEEYLYVAMKDEASRSAAAEEAAASDSASDPDDKSRTAE